VGRAVEIESFRLTFGTKAPGWVGSERPVNLLAQEEDPSDVEDIEVEVCLGSGWAENLVHIRASNETVVVGTSEGRVCFFDPNGRFLGANGVGRDPVSSSVGFDGEIGAVYSGGALTLFLHRCPVATVKFPEYFAELAMQGRNILVWAYNHAWLVDGRGARLWSGSFPRPIRTVIADHRGFSILAGPLHRFEVEQPRKIAIQHDHKAPPDTALC
jgi:hypothetical protein